jgi:hypothetical protein
MIFSSKKFKKPWKNLLCSQLWRLAPESKAVPCPLKNVPLGKSPLAPPQVARLDVDQKRLGVASQRRKEDRGRQRVIHGGQVYFRERSQGQPSALAVLRVRHREAIVTITCSATLALGSLTGTQRRPLL